MASLEDIKYSSTRQLGFTFVEVVFVIVILGVVASFGSGMLVNTVDSYRTTQARSVLVQRGRITVEQISRQVRRAVPNSVRVSSSGNCIEFMPIVAGTNYQNPVPDQSNGQAVTDSIATGAFSLGMGLPAHVVVAPFYASEIYTSATTAARVGVGTLGAEPISSVPLAQNHRFLRNSGSRRIFIAANPERYCLSGQILYSYTGYGFLTSALGDSDPGGNADILAHNISTNGQLFSLSPGSEDRNTAVFIDLVIASGRNTLNFDHEVLVRNVP